MLSELFHDFVSLANKAQEPSLVPLPEGADPSIGKILNPSTGLITDVSVLPPPRRHKVLTLLSLANAISKYAVDVVIWCGMEQAQAIIDDEHDSFRRDSVTLRLEPSPLFALLPSRGTKPMKQKEFYWYLKHDLAAAVLLPNTLLVAVQQMSFTTKSESEGNVSSVGKNTFGRSVMSEAIGASELPEEIDIAFEPWPASRIFETTYRVNVKCSLRVDAVEATLMLTPQPGEIEAAKAAALDALCLRVAEVTGVPSERVFAGSV